MTSTSQMEQLVGLARLLASDQSPDSVVNSALPALATLTAADTALVMRHSMDGHRVLLDLAMPRMDGLEALPLIRAAVPGVRVIVLSGFNESTAAQKALDAGADHYVAKGGSLSHLLELIDSLLEPSC